MSELLSDAKDGLSQNERRITALFPENFRIDDNTSLDLLKYMFDLAAGLNYYNFKNEIDGDWRDFFFAAPNLLVSLTNHLDLSENLTRFERIETQIRLAGNEDELFENVQHLFEFFGEVLTALRGLQGQFKKLHVNNQLVKKLVAQVSHFDDIFGRFKSAHQQFQQAFGNRLTDIPVIDDMPGSYDTGYRLFGDETESTRIRVTSSLEYIKGLFNDLRVRFNNFLGAVNYYLRGYDMFKDEHPPHLALILTFIKLYEHLQEEINALPRKHLEFYYKNVLGLQQRGAEPDSVHVFFEPEPLINSILVEKGREMLAGIFQDQPIIFTTNEPVEVTAAKISQLKTLYIASEKLSEDADIAQLTPYQADHAVIAPGEYSKNGFVPTSWPAMGEDQSRYGYDERTMTESEIATIIASPMLYLPEGDRLIILYFYLENESGKELNNFIDQYEDLGTVKDSNQAIFSLFNNAFLIDYTTETGWHPVKHTTTYYPNGAEGYLEIKLEVLVKDPAFALYNTGLHGNVINVDQPAIKITLNGNAPTNPYSFLNNIQVGRIHMVAEVKGFGSVKLNNNIGALSASTAFQPFGPLPLAGAYLDIKNTNVFNRYTTSANVYLEWIGLPVLAGGWAEYYEAYSADIRTDSFKIKVSSVNNGKAVPDQDEQQEVTLFNTGYDDEGHESLQNITALDHINFQQLEFSNQPLMNAEDDIRNATFRDGVLRLELSSPAEGFGGRIYPQIFSDIVLHNNRRFVHKKPVPNPPYIPLVKTVQLDYVLEYTELVNSQVNYDDKNTGLQLIHLLPFGYKKEHPVNDDKARTLFPKIDKNRNLYMGLDKVMPGQELSLLFYLEDHNFIESIDDDVIINWWYLSHNNWLPLSATNILDDATNNLINTGIIRLRIPHEVYTRSTILPSGLFWLRASVEGSANVYAKIIAVYPNAVTATRNFAAGQDNMPTQLAPNSVTEFKAKVTGVKNIWQPFVSFNGMPKESIEDYYVRVSERLGHKRRPVTVNQIEQFVLQHFPDILMAKCVNLNETAIAQTIGPGITIKVVVIPKITANDQLYADQPRVNMATLFKVHQLLKKAVPSFINIQVANPVYERVKIVATVVFTDHNNLSQQAYLNQLIYDIRKFFCPWLDASVFEIKVGSKIFVAEIMSYIKGLNYVSQLTGFSVVHFYTRHNVKTGEDFHTVEDIAVTKQNFIQASVPHAILIPAEQHVITVASNVGYEAPKGVGINKLAIGDEFLVIDENAEVKKQQATEEIQTDDEVFNLTIRHF